MSKLGRIKKSRRKVESSSKKLSKQRYRRVQAEKGNVLEALFGKPK